MQIIICSHRSSRNVLFSYLSHSPGAGHKGAEEEESLPVPDKNKKANKKKSTAEKHQRRDDLRLTRMMLIIFCCFLLCFLPLMVVNVADDEVITPDIYR